MDGIPANLTLSAQFQLMYQQQQENIQNRLIGNGGVPMQISNGPLKLQMSLPPDMELADGGHVNNYIRQQACQVLEQNSRTLQLASFGCSNATAPRHFSLIPSAQPIIRYAQLPTTALRPSNNYSSMNITRFRSTVNNVQGTVHANPPNGQQRGRPSRYDM